MHKGNRLIEFFLVLISGLSCSKETIVAIRKAEKSLDGLMQFRSGQDFLTEGVGMKPLRSDHDYRYFSGDFLQKLPVLRLSHNAELRGIDDKAAASFKAL